MLSPTLSRRLRRLIVRYRRPLAAGCAFCSVLLAITSLQPDAPFTGPADDNSGNAESSAWEDMRPRVGYVAAPVRLADGDVARLLGPGTVVDVLAADGRGRATVVADGVEVLQVPDTADEGFGDSGFGGSLVLLAVTATEATELAATAAVGPLSVVLHG